MTRFLVRLMACAIGVAAGACGGATPETASPASEPAPAPAATSAQAGKAAEPPALPSADEPAAEETATPEPTPEAEPESDARQAPSAILGAPNGAFVIDYNASAPKAAAEKKCNAEAGQDVTKRHECMQKERASFVADVLRFKKDSQGRWRLTVYQRKGSTLPEVYAGDIELSDETKGSIKIRIKGTKSGVLPLFAATKQGVISFPNDYSISIDDPKHGRLLYDAKVGLVGD